MGIKEGIGQVGEDIREFVEDIKQLGLNEALFHQHYRSRYPQARLLNQEGEVISEGLLVSLNEEYFTIRERADHGYVHGSNSFREDTRIETKDGIRITPEIFKQLVEGRAGKGYLKELKMRQMAMIRPLDIPEDIKEELIDSISRKPE